MIQINEGWILCSRCTLPLQYTAAQKKFFVGMVQSISTYNGHAFYVTMPEATILAGCGGGGGGGGGGLLCVYCHEIGTCVGDNVYRTN